MFGLHVAVMIVNIDISKEIFAIDMLQLYGETRLYFITWIVTRLYNVFSHSEYT